MQMDLTYTLVLLLLFTAVSNAVLYVSPSPAGSPCPAEPCHTLSEYAHNIDKYVSDNTKFVFLPGTHYLDTDFRVSNISSLVLLGDNSSLPELSSRVVCNNSAASVTITFVSQLLISTLEFTSCSKEMNFMSIDEYNNLTLASFHVFNSTTVSIFKSEVIVKDSFSTENDCPLCAELQSNVYLSGNILFQGNLGTAFYAEYTNVSVLPNTKVKFLGTTASETDDEGAVCLYQSTMNIMPNASVQLIRNIAGLNVYGGAFDVFYSVINVFPNASMDFSKNSAQFGGALSLYFSTVNLLSDSSFKFIENSADYGGGVFLLNSIVNVMSAKPLEFIANNASATGGAMYLFNSTFNLHSNTSINFKGNTASVQGGAIYIDDTFPSVYCYLESTLPTARYSDICFFQVSQKFSDIHLMFENNIAPVGSDIYGGMLNWCQLESNNKPRDVFNYIADNYRKLDISSPAYKPLYCNNGSTSMEGISINVYPGEIIDVHLIALGQRNGPSPAMIIAYPELGYLSTETTLLPITNPLTDSTCSLIQYLVNSSKMVDTVYALSVDNCASSQANNVAPSLNISVKLKKCLPFFELVSGTCNCAEEIEMHTVGYNISNQSVARNGTTWIGYDSELGYVVDLYCPFDYCDKNIISVTFNETDVQCAFNRKGLLCGQCQSNYSLLLGTGHCGKCSNYNLFLLLLFSCAGVALVVLILQLRLTVVEGTVNGLIFYANIFYVRRYQFLGPKAGVSFLNVFLAWLNLDFGIETCLYDGMDAYQNTWLQFLFPIYIWVLIGIVIIASRYSSWITRKLGSNPVAVLATLVLFSYNKILETIISALASIELLYSNKSTSEVTVTVKWFYDANIPFLEGKHVVLFVTALVVFVCLILPYTLLLIFGQYLQACSNHKVFSWVNRPAFKYFLDNYHAPYQDRHRYWTGMVLLIRIVLLVSFAFVSSNNPSQYMLAISTVMLFVLSWGWIIGVSNVYKNQLVGLLNASFIFNLSIISAATAYCCTQQSCVDDYQAAMGYTSLGVAFVKFIGILTYHVYLKIKNTKFGRKLAEKLVCCKKLPEEESLLDFSYRQKRCDFTSTSPEPEVG